MDSYLGRKMKLTSVSSSGHYARLPNLLYPRSSEFLDWWGSGRRIGFWGGMKYCFINSSGAKSLESRLVAKRLVAKRLAGSCCWDRAGVRG